MKLKFLFNEHSTISIPPVKITSQVQMKLLIKLNQSRKLTPCITLLRKNVLEIEHKDFNGEDHNANDFWD